MTTTTRPASLGILERFRTLYELPVDYPIVSLNEGNTPLIPAPKLAEWAAPGLDLNLFVKFEGANPTGSFKDRGMTFAVSQAVKDGKTHIVCASTGNTSASAAAYGARAGLQTIIVLPKGKVALGKLSQAIMYGAHIIEIEGNFDEALDIVREFAALPQVAIVNSINPYRIRGQQSGAFEICQQLGSYLGVPQPPDYHFIPVGNAGNITAYWAGYQRFMEAGHISTLPKMCGYEAEGAAAIVQGKKFDHPETLATAIRIGNPASWEAAEAARDESGGWIDSVNDDEIVAGWKAAAELEGVFAEPACGASVGGLKKATAQGKVEANSTVVCILTGQGLKDPDNAVAYGKAKKATLPADFKTICTHLNL
ncbi:MAG: threonine synthase [Cyanobacteria bacterium HKST-UBA05]|nr:threonine synthase [Cyanobacteria bacterium HKST-UBA05]